MTSLLRLTPFLCVLVLLAGCDSGQPAEESTPESVTIQGTVTLPDGSPAESTDVAVYPVNEEADPIAQDGSGEDGSYELLFETGSNTPNTLRLEAQLKKAAPYEQEVELSAVIDQDVSLPPISIGDVDELQSIDVGGSLPLDGHYRLSSDIDASETAQWNGGRGFDPIGNYTGDGTGERTGTPFTGFFDGNGYAIQGLTIDRQSVGVGLFAWTYYNSNSPGGERAIKNLALENIEVTGEEFTGGLVGHSYSQISEVFVTGQVSGSRHVGAIAGKQRVRGIVESGSSANVNASLDAGGLVGTASYAKISACYARGNVEATETGDAGGLVGVLDETNIDSSYATGDVTSNGGYGLGGLVGRYRTSSYNSIHVRSSFATGDVSGRGSLGGLVGSLVGDGNQLMVEKSYAKGDVSGTTAIGGLIGGGYGRAEIHESYASGSVSGDEDVGGVIGGVTGGSNSSLTTVYWDSIATGQNSAVPSDSSEAGIGLSTEQMTGTSAEENMTELDFENDWNAREQGYPALGWEE